MTLTTFTPSIWPSPGAQTKPELKILKADFGDGYSQPTPNGLNHIRRVMDLQWDYLEACDKTDIIDFLTARAGTEAFYFALPGQDQIAHFVCPDPWAGTYAVQDAIRNGRQHARLRPRPPRPAPRLYRLSDPRHPQARSAGG